LAHLMWKKGGSAHLMWKFWRIYCGLRPHFRRGTCARNVKTYSHANAYLVKPPDLDAFVAAIAALDTFWRTALTPSCAA